MQLSLFIDNHREDRLHLFTVGSCGQVEGDGGRNDKLCCDNKDDEQYEDDVHQRCDVDSLDRPTSALC